MSSELPVVAGTGIPTAVPAGQFKAADALPESFHGDPADRLIVATARARKLPLATRDAAIRKSRAVKLWKA